MGCMDRAFLCDGIADCGDQSDEDATFCDAFDCSSVGKDRCPGGGQCMRQGGYCDFNSDCSDGSDEGEEQCSELYKQGYCQRQGMIECPLDPTYCIYETDLCDGEEHCLGGWDEANCLDHPCPSGWLKCPKTGYCTPAGNLCDGVTDCFATPEPEDEDPDLCRAYAFAGLLPGLLPGLLGEGGCAVRAAGAVVRRAVLVSALGCCCWVGGLLGCRIAGLLDGEMGWWDGMVGWDGGMGWWDGMVGWDGGLGWWDGMVGWNGGTGWWDGMVGRDGGMGWWDGMVGWDGGLLDGGLLDGGLLDGGLLDGGLLDGGLLDGGLLDGGLLDGGLLDGGLLDGGLLDGMHCVGYVCMGVN
ncbi:unnamed protein product [Closterium sp. Yama58-4]|nr:unnamed protein product [Closterium sp. Yama58-4]